MKRSAQSAPRLRKPGSWRHHRLCRHAHNDGCSATAGSPSPLDLHTLLDGAACQAAPGRSAITLSAEVARGLIAFNTPYLFGGRALRTDLTCGACHGPSAPSGAAALLHFRVPVPDLARAFARGPMSRLLSAML